MSMLRPRAVTVSPMPDYQLLIDFSNGERRIFDVKPYIKGEWFGELQDTAIFNQVMIAGLSVEWPDGQDICPDRLYEDSVPVQ